MYTLPKQPNQFSLPQWNQPNNSDVNGSLWASTNIDVTSNVGKLRVGDRMMLNTSDTSGYGISSNISGMGLPVAFKTLDGEPYIYAVAGSKLLISDGAFGLAGAFTTLIPGSGSLPTNLSGASDMEAFNSYLYVTGNTNSVTKIAGIGNATPILTQFTPYTSDTGEKHLTSYNGRMYMSTLGSQIGSWDTNDGSGVASLGSQYTLQLGNTNQNLITWIRAASNRIWIGTINLLGGKGTVYTWDGTSVSPTTFYRLESSGTLSCVIKDDVPYIMDTNGNFLYWNGGTFVKLTGLNRKDNFLLFKSLVSEASGQRFIHSNGMSVINGKICVLIDTRNYNTLFDTEETMPAGVYEYDDSTQSLIHKYSLSYLDRAGNRIAGEDFGQTKISAAGALSEMNIPSTNSVRNGTFLAGAGIYSNATNPIYGIWYDDSYRTQQKAGSFISTKLPAVDYQGNPTVKAMWNSYITIYKSFLDNASKIVSKYRIKEQEPVEATITWTSPTTFTVPNSSVNISNYWTSGVGGEVEILNGVGAGRCAHIIKAKLALFSGTWTVTVDETYTTASNQTAIARFQNWIKISSITVSSNNNEGQNSDTIGASSTWIQFKVWMLFTDKHEIEKILITSADNLPAK